MPSVASVVEIIRNRIKKGDYRVNSFPANRRLADELGVSRQTVRKAIDVLITEGVLKMSPTGRVETTVCTEGITKHLALLAPAYPSPILICLYDAIESIAAEYSWDVKTFHYTHWHDPTIPSVLKGMDGTFFLPFANDMPREVIRFLLEAPKVVVAGRDMSASGLPSLQIFPPRFVGKLLDDAGCAANGLVACLNTQPMDIQMQGRIDYWAQWVALNSVKGPLINEPVRPAFSAAFQARDVMSRLLANERNGILSDVHTIFCTTSAAALGAMRAMADFGLKPGVDLMVCAADSAFGESKLYIPSLTCLDAPDLDPFVRFILEWMSDDDAQWPGALLIEASEPNIFVGESTGIEK